MDDINEIAWSFYCQETAGSMHVLDYWEDLSQDLKERFTFKVTKARVVCAANKIEVSPGNHVIVTGARHHDSIMNNQIRAIFGARACEIGNQEQGFIDQFCHFLTREQAWQIAAFQNQIIRRVGGDGKRLYSENLY